MNTRNVSKYSWGGDVVLTSRSGDIRPQAGSIVDVSTTNSDAGTLAVLATGQGAGRVDLNGVLRGTGGKGYRGGAIDVSAQRLGDGSLSAGFSALREPWPSSCFPFCRVLPSWPPMRGLASMKASAVIVSQGDGGGASGGTIASALPMVGVTAALGGASA